MASSIIRSTSSLSPKLLIGFSQNNREAPETVLRIRIESPVQLQCLPAHRTYGRGHCGFQAFLSTPPRLQYILTLMPAGWYRGDFSARILRTPVYLSLFSMQAQKETQRSELGQHEKEGHVPYL